MAELPSPRPSVAKNDPSRRSRSYTSTGQFISLTTGQKLVFQGIGQRDLLILLDVDFRTIDLCTFAGVTIDWPSPGKRALKPDIFAEAITGERCYWKVLSHRKVSSDPKFAAHKEEARRACGFFGASFRIFCRECMSSKTRLANSRWVHAAASAIQTAETARLHDILSGMNSPKSIGELRHEGLTDRLFDCLLGLVGNREVQIPLDKPINDLTMVRW